MRYLGVSWYLLCIEVMCFWYVVMRCLCDGGEMVLVHWCKMSSEVAIVFEVQQHLVVGYKACTSYMQLLLPIAFYCQPYKN